MPKNLLIVAIAVTVSASSLIACSTSDDEGSSAAAPEAVIGPVFDDAGVAAPRETAAVPVFDFGGAVTPATPDAGPTVTPVENDPGAAQGVRIFGTDRDGRLVSFRENAPETVAVKQFAGLAAGERMLDVTFRPVNSVLFGLTNQSRIYTINPTSGEAFMVGDGTPFTPALQAIASGFDFNPVADKLRIHTDVDQDLRVDPITGKVIMMDGMLAFANGDVNFGQSPNLVGTAYTNSVAPAPATTTLYAIDSTRNLLTRLPNPNDGMVETVGPMGVDFDQAAGFDVARSGIAYAALHVGAETGLYTVDLASGAATKKGTIAHPVALTSIAVQP